MYNFQTRFGKIRLFIQKKKKTIVENKFNNKTLGGSIETTLVESKSKPLYALIDGMRLKIFFKQILYSRTATTLNHLNNLLKIVWRGWLLGPSKYVHLLIYSDTLHFIIIEFRCINEPHPSLIKLFNYDIVNKSESSYCTFNNFNINPNI